MRTKFWKLALGAIAATAISTSAVAQKSGGTLNIVVGSKIPSYDGHIESTFGMIHPIAPFYSLLVRVNPANPSDPTDFEYAAIEREAAVDTRSKKTGAVVSDLRTRWENEAARLGIDAASLTDSIAEATREPPIEPTPVAAPVVAVTVSKWLIG